jgi:3-oxoacyl-[acyl-carrier protein] reductase
VHGWKPGQCDAVVSAIEAAGGVAGAVVGDVTTTDGAASVFDEACQLGVVSVLVNNYGTPVGTKWGSGDGDRWHDAWERNVVQASRLTDLAVPAMRELGWGRIVFLGTVGTMMPGTRNPDYYGAKAALPAIVRSLAKELSGSGITANLVSPGIIATAEMREVVERQAAKAGVSGDWDDVLSPWAAAKLFPNLVGRVPDPRDIANLVAYVVSEAAWPITGTDLRIDGGAPDAD